MTVLELSRLLEARVINMPDPNRNVEDGYCGDFLSFVMQRAPEDAVWFTVMTNLNVAAVASLTGVGAVVVCEGSKCDDTLIAKAKEHEICLLETDLDIFGAVKTYLGK